MADKESGTVKGRLEEWRVQAERQAGCQLKTLRADNGKEFHGEVERVYLRQPEGADDGTGRVYRLRKAMYGLKQAPLLWNADLGEHLREHGYQASTSDPSLFMQQGQAGRTFIPVWVDDLLVISETEQGVKAVKEVLGSKYAIKDLGEVKTYLGMQVQRDRAAGWMQLSLTKYIRELAERFAGLLAGTKKAATPMAPDILHRIRGEQEDWSQDEVPKVQRTEFLSVIGSLMFAATTCRPDLCFTVSTLAQASADPRRIHMTAAVRALRYLIDTKHFVLRYDRRMGAEVVGYSDADWASEADAKSRAAFVFKLGGGVFGWASRKLQSISTSTTVAEYKALSEAAKEAVWLKQLLEEIGQGQDAIVLHCDNQSSIKLSCKLSRLNQKIKHLKVAWHFIKQAVEDGDVQVDFVRSAQQDADMLTKALDGPRHRDNRGRVGLQPAQDSRAGLSALFESVLSS
jgi:hypothetical protein